MATDRPAKALSDRAGRLAREVFGGLEGDISGAAALALVTFDVLRGTRLRADYSAGTSAFSARSFRLSASFSQITPAMITPSHSA